MLILHLHQVNQRKRKARESALPTILNRARKRITRARKRIIMSNIDNLSVGSSLSRAGLRDLSISGKAPRAGKFKQLTLGALNQLAIAL